MNISNYLSKAGISQSDFARELDVPPALIYQWLRGLRPVAVKHCMKIEAKTGGEVSRRDLRPDDWHQIWPELSRRRKGESVLPP